MTNWTIKNTNWQRYEFAGCPIYLNPDVPDWFVPSASADRVIQGYSVDESSPDFHLERLRLLIDPGAIAHYQGRFKHLTLTRLRELWIHLTNACDLSCCHCLFSSSPAQADHLPQEYLDLAIKQALELGLELLIFTGGEPLVYPGLLPRLADLLAANPKLHVVVLTNGMAVPRHLDDLRRLPRKRFHLQLSMDGLEKGHDLIRGKGTYQKLINSVNLLQAEGFAVTLSTVVQRDNVNDLPTLTLVAAEMGVKNIHYLWYFKRGKGDDSRFVAPEQIFNNLLKAHQVAGKLGVIIDNFDYLRAQVMAPRGTRHDLSNSGWQSLAIGPDACIYPSPALVALDEMNMGHLSQGLAEVWRNSKISYKVRRASLLDHSRTADDPFRFLTGGGDHDHSFIQAGELVGHDPYLELYNKICLYLISRQAANCNQPETPEIILRMGDVRHDCPSADEDQTGVSLTHCNCLISLTGGADRSLVGDFYAQAARKDNKEIINPFAGSQQDAGYIPEVSRKRSYGCGSPVDDAAPETGEVVVDLGSGSGVECFMAADAVGGKGRVIGIDMTDDMLDLAADSKRDVVARLGYDNVNFCKGFLEAIPLADQMADAVISNCVINLSADKRQTMAEAFRILKPGGRLVVSDIVTDGPLPISIMVNHKLRGECLGGAMEQEKLVAMLQASGFRDISLLKRFPYRQLGGVDFYSLTFVAFKQAFEQDELEVIYPGPHGGLYREDGQFLLKGKRTTLTRGMNPHEDNTSLWVLDKQGAVSNQDMAGGCACTGNKSDPQPFPLAMLKNQEKISPAPESLPHLTSGCMVCGQELVYGWQEKDTVCHYCGSSTGASVLCKGGHFVCDSCHQQEGAEVIRHICSRSTESDILSLLTKIRSHPAVPMHGPEHHLLVPAVMVAAFANSQGIDKNEMVDLALARGARVPGGSCGFMGNCGAAVGAGIGFAIILQSTPMTPEGRQLAMGAVGRILLKLSEVTGARCCLRESVATLQEAALISREMGLDLIADSKPVCNQYPKNSDCIHQKCPLWSNREKTFSTHNIKLKNQD